MNEFQKKLVLISSGLNLIAAKYPNAQIKHEKECITIKNEDAFCHFDINNLEKMGFKCSSENSDSVRFFQIED